MMMNEIPAHNLFFIVVVIVVIVTFVVYREFQYQQIRTPWQNCEIKYIKLSWHDKIGKLMLRELLMEKIMKLGTREIKYI